MVRERSEDREDRAVPVPMARLSRMMGPKCARTFVTSATPSDLATYLGLPLAPVVSVTWSDTGEPTMAVRDLRAERRNIDEGRRRRISRQHPARGGEGGASLRGGDLHGEGGVPCRGEDPGDGRPEGTRAHGNVAAEDPRPSDADAALTLVSADVTLTGPWCCPAIMDGADVAAFDLTASGVIGERGPLTAVSLSPRAAAMGGLVTQSQEWSCDVAPSMEALDALEARTLRRNDTAATLAAYLSCHFAVEHQSYPGLTDDPAHRTAVSMLDHGFGPAMALRVARPRPEVARDLKEGLRPAGGEVAMGTRVTIVTGPAGIPGTPPGCCDLVLTVGEEDPLALVMWLEELLG